jgi:hypothetical protein
MIQTILTSTLTSISTTTTTKKNTTTTTTTTVENIFNIIMVYAEFITHITSHCIDIHE